MEAPDIKIRGLSKRFYSKGNNVVALQDVDLDVRKSEFLCIVGPSGCGKTTLLRILADLEKPSAGSVELNLDAARGARQSMVFQDNGVFPWMTVLENTCFGPRVRGIAKDQREATARELLQQLGLHDFENAYPHQLSGGMRQRVNIARAFANDPMILLMDEPLASLDEQTKMLVQSDLLELWEGTGKVVLFITHSLDEAITLADRVVVMSARPGRIKAIVDVELPRPRDALELRNDPRFTRIRKKVWDALRDEVIAARNSGN